MDARLAQIILRIAEKRAPHVLHNGQNGADIDPGRIARQLAGENVLVLAAYLPDRAITASVSDLVADWCRMYTDLYNGFAYLAFSSVSHTTPQAVYADDPARMPVIIELYAQTTPVLEAIAGFVVPFVVRGQARGRVEEQDYHTLFNVLCDELYCTDLPPFDLARLRTSTLQTVQALIAQPLRQVWLNDFDRPILDNGPEPPLRPQPFRPSPPAPVRPSMPPEHPYGGGQMPGAATSPQRVEKRPGPPPSPPTTLPETSQRDASRPMQPVNPESDSQRLDSQALDSQARDSQRLDSRKLKGKDKTGLLPPLPPKPADRGRTTPPILPVPGMPPNGKKKKT